MDKENFKIKLLELIQKTETEITELGKDTQPVSPDNAIGRISRMDAINNKSVNDAAMRNLQQKLTGLQNLLNNLEHEDFGKCAKCKADIPEMRMLLAPHSRFCVKCAR